MHLKGMSSSSVCPLVHPYELLMSCGIFLPYGRNVPHASLVLGKSPRICLQVKLLQRTYHICKFTTDGTAEDSSVSITDQSTLMD